MAFLNKEQETNIDNLLSYVVKKNDYKKELEIRLGSFSGKGFESTVDTKLFEYFKSVHTNYPSEFTISKDEIYNVNGERWRKTTVYNEEKKVKNVFFTQKNKISSLDVKEYNFRVALAEEKVVKDVELGKSILEFTRNKFRYSYKLASGITLDMTEILEEGKTKKREIEIEFDGKDLNFFLSVLKQIIVVMQGSKFIITETEKKTVLNNYLSIMKTKVRKISGAQPVSLQLNNLKKLVMTDYAVTAKADGERNCLYFFNDSAYIFDNKLNIRKFSVLKTNNMHNTVLDGEYIDNKFYAFDLIYYINNDLRGNKNYGLEKRLEILHQLQNYISVKEVLIKGNIFEIKEYYFPPEKDTNIFSMSQHILNNPPSYKLDGLIFTPIDDPYPFTKQWDKLFKWKFPELNSIDLKIQKKEVLNGDGQVWNLWVFNGIEYELFKPKIVDEKYKNLYRTLVPVQESNKYEDGSIVEFVLKGNSLQPLRTRDDKITSNFISVAYDVLNNIINPLDMNSLKKLSETEFQNLNKEINNLVSKNGKTEVKNSNKFFNMRKFHNQVKKDMVEELAEKYKIKKLISIGSGKGGDMKKWHDSKIEQVIGFDINENFIDEAYKRLSNSDFKKSQFVFKRCDVRTGDIRVCGELGEKNWEADAVEMQFSIHYFLESESTFMNLMNNVVKNLKTGGIFYGTFLDGYKIHNKSKDDPLSNNKNFHKNIIEKDENGKILFNIQKNYDYLINYDYVPVFGSKLTVNLEAETISVSEEYIVKMRNLIKIMEEKFSLRFVEVKDFKELYEKKYKNEYELKNYEKEYSFLSKTFVLQKVSTDPKLISLSSAFNSIKLDKKPLEIKWINSKKYKGFSYAADYKAKDTLLMLEEIPKNFSNDYKNFYSYVVIKDGKIHEANIDPINFEETFFVMMKDLENDVDILFRDDENVTVKFDKKSWNRLVSSTVKSVVKSVKEKPAEKIIVSEKVVSPETLINGVKFKDLKLAELKEIAKKENVSYSGKKIEIATRIINK